MQPLARPNRKNRDGSVASSTPYSAAEVELALRTSRYEVYRHELHRLVAGAWVNVMDLTNYVTEATISYDRWAKPNMRSGEYRILDDGLVNWRTDTIRTFWQMRMPDGNYAEWLMATNALQVTNAPVMKPRLRPCSGVDALMALEQSKITDWLTIPSTPDPPHTFDAGDPVGWARALILDRYPADGLDIPATALRIPSTAAKVYEPGTSILDICDDVLLYVGYDQLWATSGGVRTSAPYVRPSARAVEFTYADTTDSIMVQDSAVTEEDLSGAYNQWVRTVSRPDRSVLRASYTLTDPANQLSTVYRGRTVTDYAAVDVANQTELDNLVMKLAEEGQRVFRHLSLEVPLMPHDHHDKVRVEFTSAATNHDHAFAGLYTTGDYFVRGWTFPCTPGGRMKLTLESSPPTPVSSL